MNALKIAKKDIKNILKNKFICISIIAVVVVSALYAFLYLKAFWNPYGSLTNMPIAVVNLDKGVNFEGENINYGKDLIDKLKKSTDVGWVFTNDEEADKGLYGDKYYAKFIVPKEFSSSVVSAKNDKPKKANFKFITNEKKNFLASQISSKVEGELEKQISETIVKNYVEGTFDKLYEVKKGFSLASDGSFEIYSGINNLNSKIPSLTKGITDLNKGSSTLYTGQSNLNTGINKVNNGLEKLDNKSSVIIESSKKLSSGSNELKKGVNTLENASYKLGEGSKYLYTVFLNEIYPSVKKLQEGSDTLNKGLNSNINDVKKLEEGSKTLKLSGDKIRESSNNISSSYNNINNEINNSLDSINSSTYVLNSVYKDLENEDIDIDKVLAKLKKLENELEDNISELKGIKVQTNKFNKNINEYAKVVDGYTSGVNNYIDNISESTNSIKELSNGITQINNGLNVLEKGLNTKNENSFGNGLKSISDNTNNLSNGISDLNKGAEKLDFGVNEFGENMPILTSGVNELYKGTNELSKGSGDLLKGQKSLNEGIEKIEEKTPELKDGVEKLDEGSKELSNSLKSGKEDLEKGLVNSSKEMGDFVSAPFNVESSIKNKVDNYGTGFAPYFMPLSLWVGSMMVFFVVSLKLDDSVQASKRNKVIGKFLTFGFVGVLQALLVGISVLLLGLKPTNIFLYFILLILLSQVFLSIVYCLVSLLGDVGRLLSVVFLMLQLTGCAGTFPVELLPGFFKAINPYLPFTYAVEMLREVISSTTVNYSLIMKDSIVLVFIMLLFLSLSVVLKNKSEKIKDFIEVIKEKKVDVKA